MDVNQISVSNTGITSSMRQLHLPSDLQYPKGRPWQQDADQPEVIHRLVCNDISTCDKVVPGSARVVGSRVITLMPTDDNNWDETLAEVKNILSKY